MVDETLKNKCIQASKAIRRDIIEMTYASGNVGAHLGGSLSMVEMLAVCYLGIAKYDINDWEWEQRDRVILSKGHAALVLYAVFAQAGIIPKEKGRIASAIGGAISENLMSKDVLEKNLLSDEMITKIRISINSFFETQKNNQETVREFLAHYLTANDTDRLIRGLKESLTDQVSTKLGEYNLGEQISEVVMEVQKKVKYVLEKTLELDEVLVNVYVQGVKVVD